MHTVKNSSEFKKLQTSGKKFYSKSFIIVGNQTSNARVGFTISKKVGKAVIRNKLRRRLKAIFASFGKENPDFDLTLIIIAKKQILDLKFSELKAQIYKAINFLRNKA